MDLFSVNRPDVIIISKNQRSTNVLVLAGNGNPQDDNIFNDQNCPIGSEYTNLETGVVFQKLKANVWSVKGRGYAGSVVDSTALSDFEDGDVYPIGCYVHNKDDNSIVFRNANTGAAADWSTTLDPDA